MHRISCTHVLFEPYGIGSLEELSVASAHVEQNKAIVGASQDARCLQQRLGVLFRRNAAGKEDDESILR